MKERIARRDGNLSKRSERKKQDVENTVCIKEVLHAEPEKISGERLVHAKLKIPIKIFKGTAKLFEGGCEYCIQSI